MKKILSIEIFCLSKRQFIATSEVTNHIFFKISSNDRKSYYIALHMKFVNTYLIPAYNRCSNQGVFNCNCRVMVMILEQCRFSEKLQKIDNYVTFEWKKWKSRFKKSYFLKICGCSCTHCNHANHGPAMCTKSPFFTLCFIMPIFGLLIVMEWDKNWA